MERDTIYAPASAVGGAIAVIRISGPRTAEMTKVLSRDIVKKPGMLLHTRVLSDGETVDDAMAVYFPHPGSYTGEDMAELHCHGGAMTVQRVLSVLGSLGFRPAEGGEFTRRAFLNGKMDLTEAEAVMDVITASAEQSLKAAVSQLGGSVRREISGLEQQLLDALSGIDAAIDYPDEAEEDAYRDLPVAINSVLSKAEQLLRNGRAGRILRSGMRVVIVGRPNVGKSSLLNALSGEERAIVTSLAGTTRDTLDAVVSMGGVPVRLIDTAGLRETDDLVERIGVDRAKKELETADLVLRILDGSMPLTEEDHEVLASTEGQPHLTLCNKCDLPQAAELPQDGIAVSAVTGEGLNAVREAISAIARPENADAGLITNERQLDALARAADALRDALKAEELELTATDIRTALHALGEITGTDVDDMVIDRIFSRFCVGK